jgi:hypothetical protein
MRSTAKLIRIHSLALLIFSMVILQACGDSETTAPDGSTITVNPSDITITNVDDAALNFNIVVRYADGKPMPYAIVHITGSFAEPYGNAHYQFYYFPNGPSNPTGNTAVDSGFDVQTDEFGVYNFSIVIYGGSVFDDTIHFTSGSAVDEVTLSVGGGS